MNSDGATEAPDRKKRTWIGKLLAKRKTQKSEYEDGFANLLKTTGLKMVARAKNLRDHAINLNEFKSKRQSPEKES
jgi:hypothetical protein